MDKDKVGRVAASGETGSREPSPASGLGPAGFDPARDPTFLRMRHDIAFLLSCLDMCDEAAAPPCELDHLDKAILSDIRRDYPQVPGDSEGIAQKGHPND